MDVDPDVIFPRTKIGRDHAMRDMFRHGKVIDRKLDEKMGPLVRVQYLDKQGLISKWLQVKQPGSRLTMHYYCPKVGDDVNVTMLPNGCEDGFVDGSFFNKRNPPPADLDINTRHFRTEDKTTIEYREVDHTFLLDASQAGTNGGGARAGEGEGGTVIVKALLVQIEAGTIEETATEIIKLTAPEITETGTTIIKLTAPEITLTGHMTFIGDITHTGNMTTSGVHTDANGIHMGAADRDEIAILRQEVEELRTQVRTFEHVLKLRGLM